MRQKIEPRPKPQELVLKFEILSTKGKDLLYEEN
ncbi:MAG: hypothetical protein ACI8P3_004574 [Saprospiraceae bacterium]|jgi:hypothetical protein